MYHMSISSVYEEITPYAILSGKNVDDLGYPSFCERNSSNLYTTAEATITTNSSSTYDVYLGVCFSNKCSVQQLNEYGRTHPS